MKKMEIKFDLQSFLEDIAKMSPQDLGISRMLLVVETDYPEEKETNTQILLAVDSVLDASGLVYRAMEKEPKVALAMTLAMATFITEVKGKKK